MKFKKLGVSCPRGIRTTLLSKSTMERKLTSCSLTTSSRVISLVSQYILSFLGLLILPKKLEQMHLSQCSLSRMRNSSTWSLVSCTSLSIKRAVFSMSPQSQCSGSILLRYSLIISPYLHSLWTGFIMEDSSEVTEILRRWSLNLGLLSTKNLMVWSVVLQLKQQCVQIFLNSGRLKSWASRTVERRVLWGWKSFMTVSKLLRKLLWRVRMSSMFPKRQLCISGSRMNCLEGRITCSTTNLRLSQQVRSDCSSSITVNIFFFCRLSSRFTRFRSTYPRHIRWISIAAAIAFSPFLTCIIYNPAGHRSLPPPESQHHYTQGYQLKTKAGDGEGSGQDKYGVESGRDGDRSGSRGASPDNGVVGAKEGECEGVERGGRRILVVVELIMQMDKVTKRKAKEYLQQIHPLLRNHTHLLSPIPTSIFINKSLFSTFSFLDQMRASLYSPTLKERQTAPNPPRLHRHPRTSPPLPLRPFFSFRPAAHPSGTSRTRQKSKLWRDDNPASQLTPSPSLSNHPTPPSPDPACATPFYHQLFLKLITHWTRQLLPLPPPSCQKDTRGGWICREGGDGGNGGARGGRKGEKGGFECEFEQILKQFLKWSSIIKGEESSIQLIERMYPFYYPFENSFYGSPFAPYYSDPNALFQLYAHAQEARPEENIPKTEEVNTNYSTNDPKPAADPHPAPTHPHPRRSGFPDANSVRPTPERKTARTSRASSGMRSLVESKQAVPKFRYTHKNFESNIINKIFSFLWSEDKSRCFVMRIVGDRAKCSLYYDYIKIVRKYCKRYINKEYLLNLCEYSEEHIAYRIVVKQTEKLKYFSMAEFSTTIRKLILLYLRSVCATSILTSKKMRKDIWREHFEKMRNIRDFLFDHLSPEEYDERMSYSYDQIYRRKLHTTPTPN